MIVAIDVELLSSRALYPTNIDAEVECALGTTTRLQTAAIASELMAAW
jgi:hypothetical protein